MLFSKQIERRLFHLANTYPFAHVETLGTSRRGHALAALVVGYGTTHIGYNATHHANEWITSLLLTQFLEEYCQHCAANPAALEETTLYAIPLVNPDGADDVIRGILPPQWKANACGVDLNSNYPASWEILRARKAAEGIDAPGPRGYPGHAPLCEPESAALAAYTQLRNFALTISLHTQGEEIYHRYRHFNPPHANKIAARFSALSGYPLIDVPDEAAHGGYRDWFIEQFNRPGFTIECGLGENPLPLDNYGKIYSEVAPILCHGLNVL